MTPERVLADIKAAVKLIDCGVVSGTTVPIYLPNDRPLLEVQDDRGHWVLVRWLRSSMNHWRYTYRYQVSNYYVAGRSPSGAHFEVDGTRTGDQVIVRKMKAALNASIHSEVVDYPFKVIEVNETECEGDSDE